MGKVQEKEVMLLKCGGLTSTSGFQRAPCWGGATFLEGSEGQWS